MITALIPLLTNKWARLGVEIAFLVALALGIRAYYIEQGKKEALAEAAQSQQQELEKARAADRQQMNDVLAPLKDVIAQAQQSRNAADAAFSKAADLLTVLSNKSAAGQTAVQALPDSGLHPYVVDTLNLRAKGDLTPGYTPAEERALAGCVTQYPICQQQLTGKDQAITAAQDQTKSADSLADARQTALDAQGKYISHLEDDFSKLYNLHPPRYRSFKCLWLWQCGEQKVTQPAQQPSSSGLAIDPTSGLPVIK